MTETAVQTVPANRRIDRLTTKICGETRVAHVTYLDVTAEQIAMTTGSEFEALVAAYAHRHTGPATITKNGRGFLVRIEKGGA